tara:strand:+ start:331 stop:507 length:177 start_codon:yes stop_codon:yes gene_type:complete
MKDFSEEITIDSDVFAFKKCRKLVKHQNHYLHFYTFSQNDIEAVGWVLNKLNHELNSN